MPTITQDGNDQLVSRTSLTPRQKALIRGLRYYHFRGAIQYSQSRPTQLRLPRETTRLDCSGLVAACMDFAGVPEPSGWRYTNTDTQISMGKPVTAQTAKPGDVAFYGRGDNPSHEALYLGTLPQLLSLVAVPDEVARAMKGKGPCVLSHGHFPMMIAELDYRDDRIAMRGLL
jgi:hypothetical protein